MVGRHKILLLHCIYSGGDIIPLLESGLVFSQISQLVSVALMENLLIEDESGLRLSSLGLTILMENINSIKLPQNLSIDTSTDIKYPKQVSWIEPDEKFRIEKQGIYDIYLPSVKQSFFES